MARRCDITGAKPSGGHRINRSGKAKKKGGIGMHITSQTRRRFFPNLKKKRIFVPELGRRISVKITARALKTIIAKGPYKVLKKAGII